MQDGVQGTQKNSVSASGAAIMAIFLVFAPQISVGVLNVANGAILQRCVAPLATTKIM